VYPVSTRTEFRAAIKRDFGHDATGRGPQQSAEDVARAIVDCINHPRPEVYPLKKAKWLSVVSVVAPALADKLVQKYSRRKV
jgi:short-subunit dehydrogenase